MADVQKIQVRSGDITQTELEKVSRPGFNFDGLLIREAMESPVAKRDAVQNLLKVTCTRDFTVTSELFTGTNKPGCLLIHLNPTVPNGLYVDVGLNQVYFGIEGGNKNLLSKFHERGVILLEADRGVPKDVDAVKDALEREASMQGLKVIPHYSQLEYYEAIKKLSDAPFSV